MTVSDPLKAVKDGVSLVGELIRVAGDDPQAKEAARNLGQSAVTLTKTINNALLPLAAVNFAFDKAKKYFSEKFESELSERAAKIPPDNLVEPKASIAGPTLQGLAFTHEEPDLKEMYLNLLATAMDSRVAGDAHPAFVEVIKQLNAEEAKLISGILRSLGAHPISEVHLIHAGEKGYRLIYRHLLNVKDLNTGLPAINPRLPAMVDNWIRLGLVDVKYDITITDAEQYSWIEGRPEVAELKQQYSEEAKSLKFKHGIILRTQFGIQFGKAIGAVV